MLCSKWRFSRFGCCAPIHASDLARRLLSQGRADSPAGHVVRMVAFGASPEGGEGRKWTTVPMVHVVKFLRHYLHEHWKVLHHAQIKDPALGVLALLQKWGDEPASAGEPRT